MQQAHILLVMDYLDGHWDAEKEARLQRLIAQEALDRHTLSQWQRVYAQTGTLPFPAPSSQLRTSFYRMLEAESEQPASPSWPVWLGWLRRNPAIRLSRLVGSSVWLVTGMIIGYLLSPASQYQTQIGQLSAEMQQMREMMVLTLIDQSSAIQRLKAVGLTSELPQVDAKVYQALLNTLNRDPQVNVRLAALEALLQHAQDARVREGLVQAITQQDSPLVQIALAQAMVQLQERQAVAPLQHLLQQENLHREAKQTIETSLKML